MSDQVPNVHDPDIRAMVLNHHEPEELWTVAGLLLSVNCRVCGNSWPCPSIKAARAIWADGRTRCPNCAEPTPEPARSPQPAASTSPDDSGAGTTDPGPGLRAPLPRVTVYSERDVCPDCKALPDEAHLPGCRA